MQFFLSFPGRRVIYRFIDREDLSRSSLFFYILSYSRHCGNSLSVIMSAHYGIDFTGHPVYTF